jgi:hypothetical protein
MTNAVGRPVNAMQVLRAATAFLEYIHAHCGGNLSPLPTYELVTGMAAALEAAWMIRAPFTPAEVEALNTFQLADYMHPFECPNDHTSGDRFAEQRDRRLQATTRGWICPHCNYTQDWAHGFMLETWAGEPTRLQSTNVVPLIRP